MTSPPAGIYVPVPTFFASIPSRSTPTPPLDLKTQSQHAIHLAKAGIRGLALLGSSGEAVALSNSERVDLIKTVRSDLASAGFSDYPLIAGTATQGINDTNPTGRSFTSWRTMGHGPRSWLFRPVG
jgi:2-keto-3-deoxy-L-rhamnonate aldolase